MATMKAVRIHSYGGTEQLRYEEAACPNAADGELLIRVHATTVNPFDTAARAGYMAGWYPYAFPLTMGLDVAGVVEGVGAGVTGFAPGDAVYGRTEPDRMGANAEYVALAATAAAIKPASLSFAEAAALPQAGFSAWCALIGAANLAAGQTVLIHGAAGGVGTQALQLAKWRGAHVIGTASHANLGLLHELGADEVIDYTATRFEQAVRDVDVVLDTVGGDTLERSWGVLKPGGLLLSLVQPPNPEVAAAHGVRQQFVMALGPMHDMLLTLGDLVEQGRVRPVVDSVLPLAEAAQAHARVEGRHTRGRVVLKVAD